MAATTTPRKRPARAPAKRAAPAEVDEFVPLQFTTPEQVEEIERAPLFSIDGVTYTIPTTVPPARALKVMRSYRLYGEQVALTEMLEEMIGTPAYLALMEWPHLTNDNLASLLDAVQKVVVGALETPKGGSSRA